MLFQQFEQHFIQDFIGMSSTNNEARKNGLISKYYMRAKGKYHFYRKPNEVAIHIFKNSSPI
uniref:Uncharacterized protein n=1 Tax=Octopus bimaculoides TaxID=37653 RepID=A0A0L8HCC8_OCTBM